MCHDQKVDWMNPYFSGWSLRLVIASSIGNNHGQIIWGFPILWWDDHSPYTMLSRIFLLRQQNVTAYVIPSGKLLHSYGKSPCLMGKSTISMAIFNSYFDITRGYMQQLLCRSCSDTWERSAKIRSVKTFQQCNLAAVQYWCVSTWITSFTLW